MSNFQKFSRGDSPRLLLQGQGKGTRWVKGGREGRGWTGRKG